MFAHYYMESYKPSAAAKQAGFPKSRGMQLYRQENIRVLIGSLIDKKQSRSIIDADWIEIELMEQLEVAKGNVKVNQLTSQGISHKAKKYDGPVALRIVETLAKRTDFNVEEDKSNVPVSINIDFSKLCNTPPAIEIQKDTWNDS